MPVTPSGILSTPADALADLVAFSARFQSITGLASAVLAKPRVYITAVDGEGASAFTRPFAEVVLNDFGLTLARGSFGSGNLYLHFESEIASGNLASHRDATYAFTNDVGQILKEIINESAWPTDPTVGRLLIREINSVGPPFRHNPAEETPYFGMWFLVEFGISG